jgi:hypothetical protein
MIASNVQ